jgi:flagellar protein FliJ
MSPKWLATLVRARQLQEDSAAQQLAEAERRARRAHARLRYDTERLEALTGDQAESTVPAFVAAAVALQAAAATHAAAAASADHADTETSERRGQLLEAARARHSAEQLQERAVTVEQLRLAAVEQRNLDDVAAAIHRRTRTEGR